MWSAFVCLFAFKNENWWVCSIFYTKKQGFTVNLAFRVNLCKYTSVYVNST